MSKELEKVRDGTYQLSVKGLPFTHLDSQLPSHTDTFDALVLDAELRQSLAAVRSLGSRGLRVAALGTTKWAPTFSSRWCQQAFICPESEGTEAYLSYLERLLDRINVRVLITSSNSTVPLIHRFRERLEQRANIALPKESALAIAINKERTLEVAKRLGLHIPRAVNVRLVSEVREALREIGLPAVIKPTDSWTWNRHKGVRLVSKLVTTPDEALRIVEQLENLGITMLFQQFLAGRRESLTFLYANDEIYARFAQWGKRTNPPLGGESVLGESIAIPQDIADQAERLVREIDLEGCSHIEFRRDDAGVPYLMEINPRLAASAELAVRSGVDFPYLLYQWANGDKIDKVTSYREGVWLRYLGGDVATTLASVKERGRPGVPSLARALLDFGISFFRPMHYYYFDWKDPLPAWTATSAFIRTHTQPLMHPASRHARDVRSRFQDKGIEPMGKSSAPVGVFDSGVGGLTILSALRQQLPHENYIYFGDTANCPYGTRSDAEIIELALRGTRVLVERGVKLIVVACNTASLAALNTLHNTFSVPFIAVVPAVESAVRTTKTGRIAIAATNQTARSPYLRRLIDEFNDGKQIFAVGCQELVTLVEQGELDGSLTEDGVKRALQPILKEDVDVIVLGCTHFPALRSLIEHVAGHNVKVIDNALDIARRTHSILQAEALLHPVDLDNPTFGELEAHCSGDPYSFSKVASKILGYPVFALQTQPEKVPSGTLLS